ncbi:MAG: hypothetical protein WBV77_03250, partial [Solirubrobacteraceae bacterium]
MRFVRVHGCSMVRLVVIAVRSLFGPEQLAFGVLSSLVLAGVFVRAVGAVVGVLLAVCSLLVAGSGEMARR